MEEKSLISLLTEEDRIVREIMFKKEDASAFSRYSKDADEKRETYGKVAKKAADEVVELEKSLDFIRKELQGYIKYIMEKYGDTTTDPGVL